MTIEDLTPRPILAVSADFSALRAATEIAHAAEVSARCRRIMRMPEGAVT